MKQLKISLEDGVRESLEAAAKAGGHSLGEEIRQRLDRTFQEADPQTRELLDAIDSLTTLVRLQTGRDWHEHAGANRVLRRAILARLTRLKPEGEESFAGSDLPKHPLVASTDPDEMGLGLEAINFSTTPRTEADWQLLRQAKEVSERELRAIHEADKKGGRK